MSVTSLMVQAVTLRKRKDVDDMPRTQTGEIDDSDLSLIFDTEATTMYLEPSRGGAGSSFAASQEAAAERNTPIGDWFGMGRISIEWSAWDQVVYGSHVFDIIGPPRPFTNPRTGQDSHVELSLQEIG